ncbi:hypothetical protein, partial [Lysinibacillus agricola]|uniref:hypothetical protein n=1 Tax=Lysinibacillus agricola TaxID=2590012 RepID=UPI003C184161
MNTIYPAAAASLHYAFAQKTSVGPRPWSASEAAHRTPPGSFALCESEASATNSLLCESEASATNSLLCESEASATNVYCAKAKRQQQMFTVRKRSVSNKCLLCESEATATNVYCAKAKRQQQMFYLCESEASATNVLSVRKRSV